MAADERSREALISDILRLDSRIFERAKHMQPPGWFELDLTMAQLKVLIYLFVVEGASMGDLAATMGVALSSVTPVIDRLVQRDLAARGGNPADRRVVLVELTKSGRDLAQDLYRTGRVQWQTILDRLSDDELRLVDHAMTIMHRAATEETDKPPSASSAPAISDAIGGT